MLKAIHSDLEQDEREEILREFKNKQLPIVIAPMSSPGELMWMGSAWWSTTMCLLTPKITSTGSEGRRGRESKGQRLRLSTNETSENSSALKN